MYCPCCSCTALQNYEYCAYWHLYQVNGLSWLSRVQVSIPGSRVLLLQVPLLLHPCSDTLPTPSTWAPHILSSTSLPFSPQDGSIEFQLKLTGILSTSMAPVDEVLPAHGVRVADRVNATVHQVRGREGD